jgi:hypothetical protein
MRAIMGGMEKHSRTVRGWFVILIGCCFFLGTAVMLYRGKVGRFNVVVTRKDSPIFYWAEVLLIFATEIYVTWLGVETLSRDEEEK